MKLKIIILIAILIGSLSSCRSARFKFKEPSRLYQKELEEEASPDFRQGWQDGCESGMKAGSNSFNQMFYKGNKQDGYKMAYSRDYQLGWRYAWWMCYRADYVDQKSTIYSSFFKGLI